LAVFFEDTAGKKSGAWFFHVTGRALDLVHALVASDEFCEALVLKLGVGEMVDGEIGGRDDALYLTLAFGALIEVIGAELLVDLDFFFATVTGLAGVFVDVNWHDVTILLD